MKYYYLRYLVGNIDIFKCATIDDNIVGAAATIHSSFLD
jgi:hypothetical protein